MVGLTTFKALASVIRNDRWTELRDVIDAELALFRAQLLLLTEPRGAFTVAGAPPASGPPSEEDRLLADRLSCAVLRASRHGLFRPRCLARAIALSRLLSAHGVEGHTIRIGVSQENGEFIAHAWVERGTSVLGDSVAHTRTFAPLTSVRLGHQFSA